MKNTQNAKPLLTELYLKGKPFIIKFGLMQQKKRYLENLADSLIE